MNQNHFGSKHASNKVFFSRKHSLTKPHPQRPTCFIPTIRLVFTNFSYFQKFDSTIFKGSWHALMNYLNPNLL